jgi:hypothetical protein
MLHGSEPLRCLTAPECAGMLAAHQGYAGTEAAPALPVLEWKDAKTDDIHSAFVRNTCQLAGLCCTACLKECQYAAARQYLKLFTSSLHGRPCLLQRHTHDNPEDTPMLSKLPAYLLDLLLQLRRLWQDGCKLASTVPMTGTIEYSHTN